MDLNEDSPNKLAADLHFIHQDCSERWGLEDDCLDTGFTSNFFEHLRSKPALDATLNEALRCLKSGGQIICFGPNIKYVVNDYWDFYDHYTCLSHPRWKKHCECEGLKSPTSSFVSCHTPWLRVACLRFSF